MSNRLGWIDYAKVIGIFLIVVGHMPNNTPQTFSFLWTFHVPLFFFISGYLHKEAPAKEFLLKKIKRILLPYIFIYLLSVAYVVIAEHKNNWTEIYQMAIGFLWGTHSYPHYVNVPLWFMASLFTVELLFNFVIKKYPLLFPLFLVTSVEIYMKGQIDLLFSIDLTLLGLNYFIIGYLFKKQDLMNKIQDSSIKLLVITIVCLAGVLLYTHFQNVWYTGKFYLVSLSGGVVGILMVICFSGLLDKLFGQLKVITFYSQNTLLIMGFHMFMIPYTYSTFILSLKIESPVINSCLAALLNILYLTPIIFIFSRYLPFIGGNQRKRKPATENIAVQS